MGLQDLEELVGLVVLVDVPKRTGFMCPGRNPARTSVAAMPEVAELLVADEVGHDVADGPSLAQRGMVPLLGGEGVEQVGEVSSLVGGELHRVGHGDGQLLACGDVGVPREVGGPAAFVGDAVADAFPTGAVAVEVAVLELDAGPVVGLGDEVDLDLARVRLVGLDLPVGADVPAEHHPVRWVVGEDAGPPALAAVLGAIDDINLMITLFL